MIRINLLGVPKPKKGKKAAAAASLAAIGSAGEGLSVVLIAAILVVVAAAWNGYCYWKLNSDGKKIQANLKQAEADYQRLSTVKSRYQEREKQKEMYKKRVDVIDKLHSEQAGPAKLLTMLGDTVNSSDQVWLNTMRDDGASIKLEGVALSVHAVADLMSNLQRTGFFKSVEIESTFQDANVKEMQAFVFTLTCAKQTQKPS